jgi:hypothetical protein
VKGEEIKKRLHEKAVDIRLEQCLELDRDYFYKRIKDMLIEVHP